MPSWPWQELPHRWDWLQCNHQHAQTQSQGFNRFERACYSFDATTHEEIQPSICWVCTTLCLSAAVSSLSYIPTTGLPQDRGLVGGSGFSGVCNHFSYMYHIKEILYSKNFLWGSDFADAQCLPFRIYFLWTHTHAHYVLYNQSYFGCLIFAVRWLSAKTMKIELLEYFPLYVRLVFWQHFEHVYYIRQVPHRQGCDNHVFPSS